MKRTPQFARQRERQILFQDHGILRARVHSTMAWIDNNHTDLACSLRRIHFRGSGGRFCRCRRLRYRFPLSQQVDEENPVAIGGTQPDIGYLVRMVDNDFRRSVSVIERNGADQTIFVVQALSKWI